MSTQQTPTSFVARCESIGTQQRNKQICDATKDATTDATARLKALAAKVLARQARNNQSNKAATDPQKVVARPIEPLPPHATNLATEETAPLDRTAPTDPDALQEYRDLKPQEQESFYGCRAVLLEEGAELSQADRDAVAAVLQHRRLITPLAPWVRRLLEREAMEAPL